jgi:hypothetical protein
LWQVGLAALLTGLFPATTLAGGIVVTNNTNTEQLVNALIGDLSGITVTNAVLSAQTNMFGSASTGIFTTTFHPPSEVNNYNLTGSGIFISTGNASQDGTSGPVIGGVTTAYDVPATPAQFNLLHQVSPTATNFKDVTQLTLTFTAAPNRNTIFFKGVFASAEFPFVVPVPDGFGLFLNGKNIAFADGMPLNIENTDMVDTNRPFGPGGAFQETAMQGLLVQKNGDPNITFRGDVVPGSTGNTLTFIVGDEGDAAFDTGVYLAFEGAGFGPAVPEPGSLTLLGCVGATLLARKALRRKNLARERSVSRKR